MWSQLKILAALLALVSGAVRRAALLHIRRLGKRLSKEIRQAKSDWCWISIRAPLPPEYSVPALRTADTLQRQGIHASSITCALL